MCKDLDIPSFYDHSIGLSYFSDSVVNLFFHLIVNVHYNLNVIFISVTGMLWCCVRFHQGVFIVVFYWRTNDILDRGRFLKHYLHIGLPKPGINIQPNKSMYWDLLFMPKICNYIYNNTVSFRTIFIQIFKTNQNIVIGVWCLTPFTTIFQLHVYLNGMFHWWRKPEYWG